MPSIDESIIASKATARFQRVSPRKARLVADLIRGRTVGEAQQILAVTHRPSAVGIVSNLLKSAVANVDHAEHADVEELVIGDIQVNDGPTMYRFRPRARGRATRIRKRFSHISMKLIPEEE